MRTHRHHLFEIILWPNGDGTFKTILNSRERLQQLGIYDDYKLTMTLSVQEHRRLHNKYMSDETRRKLSKAMKGKTNFIGKHHSDETKRKMSAAKKGENNHNYGKHLTEETRTKLSASMKGKYTGMTWKVIDGKRIWLPKECK